MNGSSATKNQKAGFALGLVFLSGFAALIYQVLWMKQIGLLFGNTSHAASATLASFFAGLAAGSWVLGRRVSTARNPLRTYAWLEAGIALTALLYFIILAIYQAIYPAIYQSVGTGSLLLLIKFGLSLLLVFPPAFCMGGTIPVIGQFMVRDRESFGKTSALMYGVNTLGAATGAGLAGFYLPLWIGFNATCVVAVAVSGAVAMVAFRLSQGITTRTFSDSVEEGEPEPVDEVLNRQQRRLREREDRVGRSSSKKAEFWSESKVSSPGRGMILFLCFLSGFGVLALEVLWTRLFSQVLENSVYTFAAILVVVLVFLALGAVVSSWLARLKAPPFFVLTGLVLAGAGAITAMPSIFMTVTNEMQLVTSRGSWGDYIFLIFKTAAAVIGPPALLLGTIFPYLMKLEEGHLKSPGLSLGRLATVNTLGAILGALMCGFVLLDWLGMWRSLQVVSLLYLFAALILPLSWDAKGVAAKAACFVLLFINVLVLDPPKLPVMSIDPESAKEILVEVWEGSDCTVAVTRSQAGLAIKINSDYSLGSTGAYMSERLQADIPLMVYPETAEVFFLGLGTGITAGSALGPQHQVKRVVACELVPEVVVAAEKYMTDVEGVDATGGLFRDRRASVLVEDGRHHLMATDDSFDMINADLFVPFRSGAGSLYTREHFESSRKRLTPEGVFVQWLPLHQLTQQDFAIIARTMIEVFDQVSMWRHNFQPGYEMVALIGHQEGQVIPASEIDSSADKLNAVSGKTHRDLWSLELPLDPQAILFFYAGNLTATRSLFDDAPLNTDDRPVIEYLAPRSYRGKGEAEPPWFLGEEFVEFVEKVQALCPPESDPLLVNRTPENRRLPLAGSAFHRARLADMKGDEGATRKSWDEFVREWMNQSD